MFLLKFMFSLHFQNIFNFFFIHLYINFLPHTIVLKLTFAHPRTTLK